MRAIRSACVRASMVLVATSRLAADASTNADANFTLPGLRAHQLRVLSPSVLELNLVNSKAPDPAEVDLWDFFSDALGARMPTPEQFVVTAAGQPVAVPAVGFKRRPLYAPLATRDLRIGNALYLQLAAPLTMTGTVQAVQVTNPDGLLWPPDVEFAATTDPMRLSPAIHVNQVGYGPKLPKRAMVGYYLGSLGEMPIPTNGGFKLIDLKNGRAYYQGPLTPRPDFGYVYTPTPYQQVFEADFSKVTRAGEYRLVVPGLGASYPFLIHSGVPMAFARSYALGLYHQRCGTNNVLPFTRHTHDACHTAPADVPTVEFRNAAAVLALVSADYANNPRHVAPQLSNFNASLYPFVRQGKVDVSGGHHDAGDYSKYTINSAAFVHHLVFAVDAFAGVSSLNNLGLPESRDHKSDLLQEAKWEADFLAKLQDGDGGFYFLVYPRDRRYENNVTPDHGDPQIVWPKTTAVTAAAVAALAQCASSRKFQSQFPKETALYLQKARLGWRFLTNAISQHGQDGAYQKLTPYGDDFMHYDELAWAACELFLATGEPAYQQKLKEWFPDPNDWATRRWGWWRMFVSYGNAIRSYAFAARSGRLKPAQLDAPYLARCEAEIRATANDHLAFAANNAYGTSFPFETKRVRAGGWYFSSERAFDITVAYQLEKRPEWLDAIVSNLNYEAGCNPVNVCYITGLGWKRQREIVHQYAQNDRRVLPPSGLPIGNIQSSFDYLNNYKSELGELCFPPDGASTAPYPIYDRWGDSFNLTTEFVILDQARSLASLAFLAAQSSYRSQAWRSGTARIAGLPQTVLTNTLITAVVQTPGRSLTGARIVWEARDQEPAPGPAFTFLPTNYGPHWVEVEVQWPDGRRVFAATNLFVSNALPSLSVAATATNAAEAGNVPGVFTFTRTGGTNEALTVTYQFTGTATKFIDYRRSQGDMPDFITIPAGASSATLTIVPVNDLVEEGAETAVLTLLPQPTYNLGSPTSATIIIGDSGLGGLAGDGFSAVLEEPLPAPVVTGAPAMTVDGEPEPLLSSARDNPPTSLALRRSAPNSVTLTWVAEPGRVYRVEYKDELSDPAWQELTGSIPATAAIISWTDTTVSAVRQRFYVVRVVH